MSSLSLDNSDRRHLTSSQSASIVIKHREMLEHGGDRKSEEIERQDCPLKTVAEVSKVAGVSEPTVKRAKKVLEVASEKAENNGECVAAGGD